MEGLVDPRVFESRTGFLVGVVLLAVMVAAMLVAYVGERRARRTLRASERTAGSAKDLEQTRRAA